jgi:Cu-Zn family superoxide dismutase
VQAAIPALDGADGGRAGAAAALHDANGACVGEVVFTSEAELTRVEISAHMPEGHSGLHAIHIHANDNPANGDGCIADPSQPASTYFVSADGHYNPSGDAHGHHAGDLPALFFTDSGVASLSFLTDRFHLDEILGSAVILHELSDNDGNIRRRSAGPVHAQHSRGDRPHRAHGQRRRTHRMWRGRVRLRLTRAARDP